MSDAAGWAAAANFAGWLTALLPRLALYPGGLVLALAAALAWIERRAGRGAAAPPAGLTPLERLALALAWGGAALLPLPGAAPLPLAPDLLALAGLLLAARLIAPGSVLPVTGLPGGPALCAGALAALAAGAGSLALPLSPLPPQVALLAALAYLAGLGTADGEMPRRDQGSGIRDQGSDDATRNTQYAIHNTFHVSRFTLQTVWLGWAGLGGALALVAVPAPAPGGGLPAGLLLIGAGGLRLVPGRERWATPVAGIGWLALGGALLAILLPG